MRVIRVPLAKCPIDMRAFAELYAELDSTTKTGIKTQVLMRYFSNTPAADAAWAVFFLTGRRVKRLVGSQNLRRWAAEMAGVPDWLFDDSYDTVGDLAETIALLLPRVESRTDIPLAVLVETKLLPLQQMDEAAQRELIIAAWDSMDEQQRFVLNKLMTGEFRVGVSQQLVIRALAEMAGIDTATVALRLVGGWEPKPESYLRLIDAETAADSASGPYPFFLAHPLEAEPSSLGELSEWQAEWKWDGIRAQLIRRAGQNCIWSRGDGLITEQFPELVEAGTTLPEGTVIDGEILPWKHDAVLPFASLQRRLGRKTPSAKIRGDIPVILMAYDLLELNGQDIRHENLANRRQKLQLLLDPDTVSPLLKISPLIEAQSWENLAQNRQSSRDCQTEGLMLKRRDSAYGTGRTRGAWWKWKIEPYTIDAVLIYAQRGHGRRASLYTDYTFALWRNDELVPFAKAYSGLTDEEIHKVDAFIRRNTLEKFGPVRSVKPELVFELAFENIQLSPRHKSGIAVRFPRIKRWRTDKLISDADTLDNLQALIRIHERVGETG